MANNRLNHLLKQRALILLHLSWLESEISTLERASIEAPENDPQDSPIPSDRIIIDDALESLEFTGESRSNQFVDEPDPKPVASDIYGKLGPETQNSVTDTRKGCVTVFGCLFLALAAIAVWIWWKY